MQNLHGRLFVNRLTADDKYSLLNRDLTEPLQILLSEKQKASSKFFFRIFEIYVKF